MESLLSVSLQQIVAESTEHTLIIVRRMMMEPKTAWAGGMVEVFARFNAWIAAFKSASRSLGRWESAFMVERGNWERTAQGEGYEDGSKP